MTHQDAPEKCSVGDFFTIADDPEAFSGMDSPVEWTGPNGATWRFEMIEVPCEGGTDFAWRRTL